MNRLDQHDEHGRTTMMGLRAARTPSPVVLASIRHADLAVEVPDDLVAFVRPVDLDGGLHDWALTEDTIAMGDHEVPQRYRRWRSQWERSWTLDPLSSIRRFAQLGELLDGRELPTAVRPLEAVADAVGRGAQRTLTPTEMGALVPAVERLRDAIRRRDAVGLGIVDATPGATTTGLARAWSPFGGAELLAAAGGFEVIADPETGLQVRRSDGTTFTGITEVEIHDDHVAVSGAPGADRSTSACFDLDEARPLAWLVPNATTWRVVTVPEVVVWARTINGLIESRDVAVEIDRGVSFSSVDALVWGALPST